MIHRPLRILQLVIKPSSGPPGMRRVAELWFLAVMGYLGHWVWWFIQS